MTPEIARREVAAARARGAYEVTHNSHKPDVSADELRDRIRIFLLNGPKTTPQIRAHLCEPGNRVYAILSTLEEAGELKSRSIKPRGKTVIEWKRV